MEAGWYSFFLGFEAYLNEPYCENVYEEGITYFGEQVSTSFPTHLCDQQMEKKNSPYIGGWGALLWGVLFGREAWEGRASFGSHTHFTYRVVLFTGTPQFQY